MKIRDVASTYLKRGLQIIPLKPGEKAPGFSDWVELSKTVTDDFFKPDDNIGIVLNNGIVDVDCDCMEAVFAARHLLPPTGAIWGRESRPRSHYLYRSDGCEYARYALSKDKSATVVELRAGKYQSMAPPSIHPSGEKIGWVRQASLVQTEDALAGFGEIGKVDAGILTRAVRLVATAALVSMCYPEKGNRHDWGVAMSGFFRKSLYLTLEEALKVIEVAGQFNHDAHFKDRLDAVQGTYRVPDDKPIAGRKALSNLIEKRFIAAMENVWGSHSHSGELEKFDETHAAVMLQSGQFIVIIENPEDGFIRFCSDTDLEKHYPQKIQTMTPAGNVRFTRISRAWLDWEDRRQYYGLELNPNRVGHSRMYNMWKGFTVEPKQGDWSLFRKHIREVICSEEDELEKYVITWMARTVQEPGKPASSAIALRGGQGTGKSTFAKWFGSIFGSHFLHLDSTRQLTGNFNAHLHNAIVVFADEAAWPGDKAGIGALRRMVTEDTLTIERKGKDVITVPNLIHMLLASNEKWVVPAAFDERRFAVLDVSPVRRNDREYFAAIQRELFECGGLSAMLYDLLKWDISDFLPIPNTEALLEQKQITAEPRMQWWHEMLDEGTIWTKDNCQKALVAGGRGATVDEWHISKDQLYDMYASVTEKAKHRYSPIGMKTQLGLFLASVCPKGYPVTMRSRSGERRWVFPSLVECRRAYAANFSAKVKWTPIRDEGASSPGTILDGRGPKREL